MLQLFTSILYLRNKSKYEIYRIERGNTTWKVEDNIKVDPKTLMCEDVDLIHLAQYCDQWQALVNVAMDPLGSVKDGGFHDQLHNCQLSRTTLLHGGKGQGNNLKCC
jgi:hypothetical protein